MALKEVAAEYFRSINSMANRLCEDMSEIKSNYEHLWEDFTESEKAEIINETIIKPEISVRYTQRVVKREFESLRKGDNNYSFKDEHSGPFRFRTISQENLFITGGNKISPKSNKGMKNVIIKEKKKEEENIEVVDGGKIIPKTGLDLLDNW